MNKQFLSIAAMLGALSVVLGAFAAHKLKDMVSPETVTIFETGVRYQFYHVFALFMVALLSQKYTNAWMNRAGNFFITGIVLFSGSLYLITAMKAAEYVSLKYVGVITPVGGLFFIAGWVCLWIGVTRK